MNNNKPQTIIVEAVAGSNLFGTNTPQSDTDYKGVYLPDPADILLQNVKNSISIKTNNTDSRNNCTDIDCEYYAFNKFMRMLQEGQTVAIELLFTPESQIITKTRLWDYIASLRHRFIHKNVSAFVGYCKTQANKYGVKGSRMGDIKCAIDKFKSKNGRLKDHWGAIKELANDRENIELIQLPLNKNTQNILIEHISICSRNFNENVRVEYMLEALNKIYAKYGHRAQLAEKNQGIDWKALSHAVRVCYQAIELLREHKLTLPLPNAMRDVVLDIKLGKMDFTNEVQPLLESLVELVKVEEQISTLPSELDSEYINTIICDVYFEHITTQNYFFKRKYIA